MNLYRRLLGYLRPYQLAVAVTWVISLTVLALQGIGIWIGANFIERIISGQSVSDMSHYGFFLTETLDRIAQYVLDRNTPFQSLVFGALALGCVRLATSILRFIKLYLFAHINQSVLARIRQDLFRHFTRLDLSFSRRNRPGEVASIFINDVDELNYALFDSVDRIFMQPLRLLLALTLMFSLSFRLTLWAIGFIFLGGLVIHFTGNRVERLSRTAMEKTAEIQGRLTEYLSSAILIRMLGKERYESKRFDETTMNLARNKRDIMVTDALVPEVVQSLFVLSAGALLLAGGYELFITKTITGNVLIKMALLMPMVTYPIQALGSLYTSVRSSMAGAKRVFGLMDEPVAFETPSDAVPARHLETGIRMDRVTFEINGRPILKDVSLNIPKGSTVVVFGPSGSGKTTLLTLIAGFNRPTSGNILVDGVDLNLIQTPSWQKRLGIVTQDPLLLNGTVRENLLYARPDADDSLLVSVLKQALMWGDRSVLPEGLDTQVGNRGEMVSGGERQRLTIARALLHEPDVLLMDEPTSMLDRVGKKQILDTILSISENRTLVIVSHEPLVKSLADVVIEIEEGEVLTAE